MAAIFGGHLDFLVDILILYFDEPYLTLILRSVQSLFWDFLLRLQDEKNKRQHELKMEMVKRGDNSIPVLTTMKA